MNIIEEITKKYGGTYTEKRTENVTTLNGQYIYQPKKGILEIDGTKISLNSNEVGGAMPVTEPLRIILMPKRRGFIPAPLRKQFWFGGNKALLLKLVSDKIFIENLINERVYIEANLKETEHVILTPEYGLESMNQFEKFVIILKQIEEKVKTAGSKA